MATRFEELIAWQKARVLSMTVYQMTSEGALTRDFSLRDQMRSAAVSIMANIAEGFERRTPRDFAHFLNISTGSSAELRSHFYVALDVGYLREESVHKALAMAEEVSKIIKALRASVLKKSEKVKGSAVR